MAKISTTARTLEYIRSRGWLADKVEQFNPHVGKCGIRKDMFHFADIVALGEKSIFAIQVCGQDFAAHERKMLDDQDVAPNVLKWLECGGRVLLVSWRKIQKARGGKLKIWAPRIKEYTIKDFLEEK